MKKRTTKKIKKTRKNKLLIFEMDGVLVDVSSSYLLAIKKTAEFFLGRLVDKEEVEEFKLKGYDDYHDCAEAMLRNKDSTIPKEIIIKKFREYYLGNNYVGVIKNETWLLDKKILEKLSKKFKLAIFTNRSKEEAIYALRRANTKKYFSTLITREDVQNKKPDPEGINIIMKRSKTKNTIYIGNSIDDLLAAKNAEVDFIGVIQPCVNKNRFKDSLKKNGAKIILDSVNQINNVI